MDQTHIHLLVTHLPIVGSILGTFVLAYGLWVKNAQVQFAAFSLLIVASLGSVLSYLTGEAAEESVEKIQGVSEAVIEEHEEFAVVGLVALIIMGCLALLGLLLTGRRSHWMNKVAYITLVSGLISFGLIAWTGYLGGQIRHTEVSAAGNQPALQNEKEEDEH